MPAPENIRVERAAAAIPSRLDIPPAVQDLLARKGLVGKWVSGDPRYLTSYTGGGGWSVVLFTEMSPEDQKLVRPHIENPERHFGEIRRGDAILVASSPDNIEFWNQVTSERNLNQMGEVPSLTFEQTNEKLREAGAPDNLLIRQNEELRRQQPTVAAHVSGGPNLDPKTLAEFRQEIEGRREEYPT